MAAEDIRTTDLPERAGVVVIGAGVIGCSVAREVTRHTPDVVILEKEADVACGTTKANNAEVHSGIGEKYGTLKQKLNVRGNPLYDDFVKDLDVEFKRQGLLIVVTPRTLPDSITGRLPRPVVNYLLSHVVPQLIIRSGRKKGIPGQRLLSREEYLTDGAARHARRCRRRLRPHLRARFSLQADDSARRALR